MRHQTKGKKFGRTRNQRKALLRTLAVSLVSKEKIKTTTAKAKELKPFVERLVTYAKKDNVASKRTLVSLIGKKPTQKLVDNIALRYKNRSGGYVRIIKLPPRKTDGSEMSFIEFV